MANNRNALLIGAVALGTAWAASALIRQRRMTDLRGQSVLITGGSRGLGLVLAREFSALGARVAICARDLEELEAARQDLRARDGNVFAFPCDVTDKNQIKEFVAATREKFGRIDVAVHNAGVIQVSPVEHLTEADYDESLKTHFWAAFHLINEVLPEMRERGSGRIVNIASVGGKVAIPHLNAYAVGKFALAGYSEGLRAELVKDNVYVTSVFPGMIRTGSPRNAFFKGQNDKEYAWFKTGDSIPGLTTSAEDCARQIIAATARGDAELIVTLPAQMLAAFHGIAPGIATEINSIVNQFLPAPGGIGAQRAKGKNSESSAANNIVTGLTDDAAANNNETVN